MTSSEFDQLSAGNEELHDVTARDHLWLVLVAVIPFTVATVWYLLS